MSSWGTDAWASGLKCVFFLDNEALAKNSSTHASTPASGQSANSTHGPVFCARLRGLLGIFLRSAPLNDFDLAMIEGSTTSRPLLRLKFDDSFGAAMSSQPRNKTSSMRSRRHLSRQLGFGGKPSAAFRKGPQAFDSAEAALCLVTRSCEQASAFLPTSIVRIGTAPLSASCGSLCW